MRRSARWEHARFWLNWADLTTLPDARTVYVHYTRSADRAELAADVFAATAAKWGGSSRFVKRPNPSTKPPAIVTISRRSIDKSRLPDTPRVSSSAMTRLCQ